MFYDLEDVSLNLMNRKVQKFNMQFQLWRKPQILIQMLWLDSLQFYLLH